MPVPIRPFFDHSRHRLEVHGNAAPLDVLAFEGEEALSKPFSYRIEFTSSARDIEAAFSLHAAPRAVPLLGVAPPVAPLRSLYGVITGFARLSGSVDEAHYQVTLQPRLALLERGHQGACSAEPQTIDTPEPVELTDAQYDLFGCISDAQTLMAKHVMAAHRSSKEQLFSQLYARVRKASEEGYFGDLDHYVERQLAHESGNTR
ncbi:Rhs element Vgr protein [compost metagenome]